MCTISKWVANCISQVCVCICVTNSTPFVARAFSLTQRQRNRVCVREYKECAWCVCLYVCMRTNFTCITNGTSQVCACVCHEHSVSVEKRKRMPRMVSQMCVCTCMESTWVTNCIPLVCARMCHTLYTRHKLYFICF